MSSRRDLRLMTTDGVLYCAMVGGGEAYFVAFALALGLGQVASGLAATVPMLVGAVLQLVTPLGLRAAGSVRLWVAGCVAVQTLAFAPLILGAGAGGMTALGLYAALSLYWAAGLAAGPPWNLWATHLVPARVRTTYFARRSRWLQLATMLALAVTGLALEFAPPDHRLEAFALVLLGAGLARAASTACLTAQSDAPRDAIPRDDAPILARVAAVARRTDRRIIGHMLAAHLGLNVAGPYLAPYILDELGLSYGAFMLVLVVLFLAKALAMPAAGRFIARHGAERALWIGAIGLVPIALLWAVARDLVTILAIQALSGIVLAIWEMSCFLVIFERVETRDRTAVLTAFNLGQACALAVGSLIGAAILRGVASPAVAWPVLFLASAALRLLAVPFLRGFHPGRGARVLAVQTLGVRPGAAGVDRPVLDE